ncbi:hypothetical protein D3C85_981740 [compost metagenome]
MNAIEIKIGNMIYIPKTTQIAEITSINKHIGVTVNNGFAVLNFNEIEPIKLTEELFLKIGFIKRFFNEDKSKPLWWKVQGNRHIEIYFEKQVSSYVYMINSLQYSSNIDFLHKLQNLYFAITETELTYETES